MASTGIRLVGDWRKLRYKFERYTELGEYMADEVLYDCAEIVKDNMHKVANSEDFVRNAPETIRKKGANTPLHETFGMEDDDSIVITSSEYNGVPMYLVQGNPEKQHIRSGTSYEDIIAINSAGSSKIPPRDVLGISYDMSKADVERYARSSLNEWIRG